MIGQNALYGLATVILGLSANCLAQEQPALSCAGSGSCPAPPGIIPAMSIPAQLQGQVGVISTGGMAFRIEDNAEIVKNQPYQAQAVTELKQTLADGSHITQTTTATVARDSEGRTVRIQKLSTIGPWRSTSESSEADSPTLTTIFDPVAKTHTDYTSDSTVARVLPIPTPPPSGAGRSAAGGFAMFAHSPASGGDAGPVTFAVQAHAGPPGPALASDAKTEQLGTETFEGIPATGTRVTSTIPAGTIGNDRDLTITRETWYSSDLNLVIRSTQSDPRFGTTTYTLTNIQRNEPDPTMFQVPPGYTVDKARPNAKMP
jgi:hypothetical protein